jgi:hypothetical protein
MSRLGMPPRCFGEHEDDDNRCEAQDELWAAIRSMGGMGMYGRFAVEITCYERRVRTQDELLYLRQALSRLAEHLRQGRRAAA